MFLGLTRTRRIGNGIHDSIRYSRACWVELHLCLCTITGRGRQGVSIRYLFKRSATQRMNVMPQFTMDPGVKIVPDILLKDISDPVCLTYTHD